MEELIKKIAANNKEFAVGALLVPSHGVPREILMIDRKSVRECSPQMQELFSIIDSWHDGVNGQSIVNPETLPELYSDPNILRAIELTAENYKPIPPSDASDWNRTAMFAREEGGLGLFLFWWEDDDDIEPAIVEVNGGTIRLYRDVMSCLREVALNETDGRGDQIYDRLEQQRGTLSD